MKFIHVENFSFAKNSVESLLHYIGAIGRIVEDSLKSSGVAIMCKAAAHTRRRLTIYNFFLW